MILLTGATGFLGSSLLKRLLAEGYQVCCLKRTTSDCRRVVDVMGACLWYDIDTEAIEPIFEKHSIQMVIHCATDYGRAGVDGLQVYRSNVSFPLELLDEARKHGCGCFINTDSFFVKQIEHLWAGEDESYMDTYTKSKYIFAHIVKDLLKDWNMVFINMRLEHIYGPDDGEKKFVSFLLEKLQRNEGQMELTAGIQTRDWIYVEDVLEAYIAVLHNMDSFEKGKCYQFEVGTGCGTSLREFVETAKKITKSSTKLLFGKRQMAANELMHSCADNRALQELGWSPRYDIIDGIKKIVGNKE